MPRLETRVGQAEAQRRLLTSLLFAPPPFWQDRSASAHRAVIGLLASLDGRPQHASCSSTVAIPIRRLAPRSLTDTHPHARSLPSPSHLSTTVSTSSNPSAALIHPFHPCFRSHARGSNHPSAPSVAHQEHPYPLCGNRNPSSAVLHTVCLYLTSTSPKRWTLPIY